MGRRCGEEETTRKVGVDPAEVEGEASRAQMQGKEDSHRAVKSSIRSSFAGNAFTEV
jgi:hypothetical protein